MMRLCGTAPLRCQSSSFAGGALLACCRAAASSAARPMITWRVTVQALPPRLGGAFPFPLQLSGASLGCSPSRQPTNPPTFGRPPSAKLIVVIRLGRVVFLRRTSFSGGFAGYHVRNPHSDRRTNLQPQDIKAAERRRSPVSFNG